VEHRGLDAEVRFQEGEQNILGKPLRPERGADCPVPLPERFAMPLYVCAQYQQSGVRVGPEGHVGLLGRAAKILRDLYPPLPNPHLLSSSRAAATSMTVRFRWISANLAVGVTR